jgi:small nuclear ribonucleoprotein (snRNP)-like protein
MKTAITFAVLMILISGQIGWAQSDKAPKWEQIRQEVAAMGVDQKVTVVTTNGQKYKGTIRAIDPDFFRVYEAYQKTVVDIRFDQVKKVEKGYKPNRNTGKRVRNALIAGAALFGILVLITAIGLHGD